MNDDYKDPIDVEREHSEKTQLKIAIVLICVVSVVAVLVITFQSINESLVVNFNADSIRPNQTIGINDISGLRDGAKLYGDFDTPEKQYERAAFRIINYDRISHIEIPLVLADSIKDVCVTSEYRFLPETTKCYEVERLN